MNQSVDGQISGAQTVASHQSDSQQHQANILSIQTPVSVTVARQAMAISQVLGLTPGAILRFEKPCTGALSVEVAGKEVAVGRAVKVGERMGVRIS